MPANLTPQYLEADKRFKAAKTVEEKVAAFEISGAPVDKFFGPDAIKRAHDAGSKLIHKVGSVRHAVHAENAHAEWVLLCNDPFSHDSRGHRGDEQLSELGDLRTGVRPDRTAGLNTPQQRAADCIERKKVAFHRA
jgi:NAD(P)H-dependent flavin oxidoreductase YrpB (nitropropane dioxygenase family)